MLPFPDFEAHIDARILQRGLDYFHNGTVQDISASGHTWRATVSGTEDYRVKLTLQNERVTEWDCTCPYEGGPICKHVVALLFALQEMEETTGLRQAAKSPGQTSVEDVIKTLSAKQLREALLYSCDNYPQLRAELLIRYAPADKGTKALPSLIRQALRKAGAGYGYIPWENMRPLVHTLSTFIGRAQNDLDNGHYRQAADTALALIETLVPALEEIDDSDGHLGGSLEQAFDILQQLLTPALPHPLAQELLAYFLNAFKQGLGAGFDFQWRWLELAVDLVQTKDEEQQLLSVLDRIKPSSEADWYGEFEAEQVLEIKLALFRKTRTPQEVARLLEDNLHLSSIRLAAVEEAYKAKDWDRVKRLCRDGIRQAQEKHLPGLAVQWQEWLLKVAHAEKDKPAQIAAAEFLLQHNHHLLDAYHLLKSLVSPIEWPERRARYLATMKRNYAEHAIMQILMEEGKAEELEALIEERSSLDFLLSYEKPLLKDFADIIRRQFPPLVFSSLEQVSGRAHYQRVASFLKRLKKQLGKDVVAPVAADLRARYKTRRALLEELEGV